MYADILAIIPVAEALFAKGAQLGAIFIFMMAVTTLSLPSLIMLRKAVKPKLLSLFIGICTGGIILVGYLFNLLHLFLVWIERRLSLWQLFEGKQKEGNAPCCCGGNFNAESMAQAEISKTEGAQTLKS